MAKKIVIRIYKTKKGNYATIDGANIPFPEALTEIKTKNLKNTEKHISEGRTVYIYEEQ